MLVGICAAFGKQATFSQGLNNIFLPSHTPLQPVPALPCLIEEEKPFRTLFLILPLGNTFQIVLPRLTSPVFDTDRLTACCDQLA